MNSQSAHSGNDINFTSRHTHTHTTLLKGGLFPFFILLHHDIIFGFFRFVLLSSMGALSSYPSSWQLTLKMLPLTVLMKHTQKDNNKVGRQHEIEWRKNKTQKKVTPRLFFKRNVNTFLLFLFLFLYCVEKRRGKGRRSHSLFIVG